MSGYALSHGELAASGAAARLRSDRALLAPATWASGRAEPGPYTGPR